MSFIVSAFMKILMMVILWTLMKIRFCCAWNNKHQRWVVRTQSHCVRILRTFGSLDFFAQTKDMLEMVMMGSHLYGTWLAFLASSPRADITFPSANKPQLMLNIVGF